MVNETGKLLVIKMQQQWQHIEHDLLAAGHQTAGTLKPRFIELQKRAVPLVNLLLRDRTGDGWCHPQSIDGISGRGCLRADRTP